MARSYSDSDLIQLIRAGGKQLEQAMRYWNDHAGIREKLDRWIKNMGGNEADSADVFQDSICHLILNIRNRKFEGSSNLQTYFMAIGKNLWFQKIRRKQNFQKIQEKIVLVEESPIDPEKIFLIEERKDRLTQLLKHTGEQCRKVLGMWSLHFTMREIATELGYKTEAVVRKKKHQCLKQLMEFIETNPELKKGL